MKLNQQYNKYIQKRKRDASCSPIKRNKIDDINYFDKIAERIYNIKMNKENPLKEFEELQRIISKEDNLLQYHVFAVGILFILQRIISNINHIEDLDIFYDYYNSINGNNNQIIEFKKRLKKMIITKSKELDNTNKCCIC